MSTIPWNDLMSNASQAFEPLPDGDYDVVIEEAAAAQSGNGKPMWKTKFRVEAGPHANRHIFNNFVLSAENPNALSFFFQHMAFLGLTREYFAQNPQPEHVAQAMVGRRCRLTLGQRSWNGQQRNDVKAVLPPSAPGLAAPAPPAMPAPTTANIPPPLPQQAPVAPAPVPQPVAAAPMQPVAPAPVAPPVPQAAPPLPQPQTVEYQTGSVAMSGQMPQAAPPVPQQPQPAPVAPPQAGQPELNLLEGQMPAPVAPEQQAAPIPAPPPVPTF